jgi:hypothetical protein
MVLSKHFKILDNAEQRIGNTAFCLHSKFRRLTTSSNSVEELHNRDY